MCVCVAPCPDEEELEEDISEGEAPKVKKKKKAKKSKESKSSKRARQRREVRFVCVCLLASIFFFETTKEKMRLQDTAERRIFF